MIEKKGSLENVEIENKEKLLDKRDELETTTWLSNREAEIVVLSNLQDEKEYNTSKELAEDLGIEPKTIYKHFSTIRQKIRKSRNLLELEITE